MEYPLGAEWGENVFVFGLARHALLRGLKLAGVRPGDAVMLPEFICRELLAPVHLAGAHPVFYPVDEQLEPVSFPAAANVKAVLAVDYFGFPQDLAPFHEYCDACHAVLIEDNAHGFLSRDAQGELLGRRGDMGILSLRKTFPLPDGGALVLNRDGLQDDHSPSPDFRDDPLPLGYRIKAAFRRIQKTTGVPLKTFGETAARAVRTFRTGSPFPETGPDCERVIPGPPGMHRESFRQLCRQDRTGEEERRKRLYFEVAECLKGTDISPVFSELPDGTVPYGFPFRAESHTASIVAARMRRMGFDCAFWPELPEAVAADAPRHYRDVHWVNFLC
ncbi:MAG: DegT/DnrJ/EryC1/StrS family aminotransferase [Terrimicrobiaceae bacterium]